ncbi:MAG: isochorismatase family protein [Chloroflexota bacterium]|nr:isochorismatase family protein [Chloroflexota bacterium]MDE2884371.1 isochorismatase family protein [Chloroflexota bacterium]
MAIYGFEDHCWQDVVSAEDIELYKHYQRDLFVGRRPAVLAIDLYNSAYQGGPQPVHEVAKEFPSACGEYAWNAIEPTKQLFAMARARGFPVFYTTGEDRPEARPTRLRSTNRRPKNQGENPFGIYEAFAPEPEDIIIYKQRASGFYGTPLVAQLVQMGVDTVLVCGESTSGCVRASVLDAYSNGFHVVIAEECVYDRGLLSHKVNLFDMHHKYADVMHLDELAEHLEAFPEA